MSKIYEYNYSEDKMKKTVFTGLLISFVIICGAYAESAKDIMKKSENLTQPNTLRSQALMTITKGGRKYVRTLNVIGIKDGKNEKILMSIKDHETNDITKILTYTKRGDDDLQWLKMPNGQKKRISTNDRGGAFVNSHLFYEDLRSRSVEDYNYKMLGEENIEGYDCYKIEATPKPGKSIYNKAVFHIIKSGEFQYFAVQIDIYFQGYLYKKAINYDIKTINGVITPKKAVMYRLNKKGRNLGNTEVVIKALQYNNPKITDVMFNQNRL